MKKIGFVVLIIVLLIALRPSFFLSIIGGNETVKKEQLNKDIYEQETQYAEGYNDSSFGAVFVSDTEEMFPVANETPPKGAWAILLELEFKIRFDNDFDDVTHRPLFTKKITALEGQIIEVEGFIIPHDIASGAVDISDDGQRFMFSAFPLATCFFCGGAGAESVLETFPKSPIPYSKRKIKIRGKLKFNKTDFLKLPYQLEDAEIVETGL